MHKFLLFIISIIFFMAACGHQPPQKTKYIRLQGSDTMKLLALRWAEDYMRLNPDISIYVEGGGSARGFESLINGEINICASSRPMSPNEVRQLAERHQRLGIAHLVAKDALSVYLNLANSISNISMSNLKDIYTGRITSWSAIGGGTGQIKLFSRSPNSGTFIYFKEHVLSNENYSEKVTICYSTQAIVDSVLSNENAIGYGGTAYGDNVKHSKIDGIEPSVNNVIHDKYPIARYLYLYTLDTPKGHIKDFIDWILDMPGQVIVAKVGYIPLFQTEVDPLP